MKTQRRTYDHRIKLAIARSKNINLFPEHEIPKTTAKNWISRGVSDVVSSDVFDLDREMLELKCFDLEKRVKMLESQFNLLKFTSAIMGFSTQYQRFKADVKKSIIDAIDIAKIAMPIAECLKTIGLSKQRFSSWLRRMKACQLEDFSSCPKLFKTKLMPTEVATIKSYVKDPRFSHFSLTSLWCYVRKHGELVVSSSTWFRVINELKLARENRKKYFCKPKLGYRASKPNQSWHIDVSVLRFNGLKAYVQAVRDNFSRMILAHRVSLSYGGQETKELIEAAIKRAQAFGYFNIPEVISDKGTENVNALVADLDTKKMIEHILAQIDIQFSNSMIESFFHQLKNRHLYFQNIHTLPVLTKHIDFYVKEQNEVIPFLAIGGGATPLQAYVSPAKVIVNKSREKEIGKAAIEKRIQFHQALICPNC